jgi:hypothetical protein
MGVGGRSSYSDRTSRRNKKNTPETPGLTRALGKIWWLALLLRRWRRGGVVSAQLGGAVTYGTSHRSTGQKMTYTAETPKPTFFFFPPRHYHCRCWCRFHKNLRLELYRPPLPKAGLRRGRRSWGWSCRGFRRFSRWRLHQRWIPAYLRDHNVFDPSALPCGEIKPQDVFIGGLVSRTDRPHYRARRHNNGTARPRRFSLHQA